MRSTTAFVIHQHVPITQLQVCQWDSFTVGRSMTTDTPLRLSLASFFLDVGTTISHQAAGRADAINRMTPTCAACVLGSIGDGTYSAAAGMTFRRKQPADVNMSLYSSQRDVV